MAVCAISCIKSSSSLWRLLKTRCKVNIAPCCCDQQTSSEFDDENLAETTMLINAAVWQQWHSHSTWRYYIATISKFTLVWAGLSGADKVNRLGLGVALLDGRRLHFGVSGRGVSVFWDLSLIFSFSGVTFRCPETSSRVVCRVKNGAIHYFGASLHPPQQAS